MDVAWESLRSTLAGYGVAPRWAAHVAVALKVRACWATVVPVADWPGVRESLDLAGCDHVAVPTADGLAYTVFNVGTGPPPFGEPAGLLGAKVVGEAFIDAVAAAHPAARVPMSEEWGRAVREHEAQLPAGFHDAA